MMGVDFWVRCIVARRPSIIAMPLTWLACGPALAAVITLVGLTYQGSMDMVFSALGFAITIGPVAAAVALALCARAGAKGVLTRARLLKLFLLTGVWFALGIAALIATLAFLVGVMNSGAETTLSFGAVFLFVLLVGGVFGIMVGVPMAFVSALIALVGFAPISLSPSEPAATS